MIPFMDDDNVSAWKKFLNALFRKSGEWTNQETGLMNGIEFDWRSFTLFPTEWRVSDNKSYNIERFDPIHEANREVLPVMLKYDVSGKKNHQVIFHFKEFK